MKILLSIIVLFSGLCVLSIPLYAQQLITPYGGFIESEAGSLGFTLGEVVITTIENEEGALTQGFQQPYLSRNFSEYGFDVNIFTGLILDNKAGNGTFTIQGLLSYPDNELYILNRWGQVLYQAAPYQNDWNGYVNGQPLPQATYYFILYPEKGNKKAVKGNLYILNNN